MQKGLLLSNEFNESELINQIHKYMILSKDSPSVKEIEKLLPELLYYLDKKLNPNTSEELFLLVKFCFSLHPNKLLPLFTEFLSKINSNRIIITASILSYLIIERRIKITDDYNSFISTSYNQIITQINKKNNKCFVIFDHEIPLKFEANFVVDIFSLIKYHKKDAIFLKNYLNSHPDTSKTKISNMIQNLSPNRIVDSLPNQYFQDTELILKLQPDGLIKFIPNIPDESFKQLLPKFDAKLQEKNRNLIKVILERCIELDVDITNHNNLIDSISSDDLNPTVWEYLAKYKIILNDELANKVTSFSNPFWAVIVMPNAINFTQKMIDHCLLNATDLHIYDRLLCTFKIKSEVFSYKNFWLHLINVVSKSQESFSKKKQLMNYQFFYNFILIQIIFENYSK